LVEIAGPMALGYEANLGKFLIDGKRQRLGLESWPVICWLTLPVLICCGTLLTPFLFWIQFDVKLTATFVISAVYSIGALIYLSKLCLWLLKLEPTPTLRNFS